MASTFVALAADDSHSEADAFSIVLDVDWKSTAPRPAHWHNDAVCYLKVSDGILHGYELKGQPPGSLGHSFWLTMKPSCLDGRAGCNVTPSILHLHNSERNSNCCMVFLWQLLEYLGRRLEVCLIRDSTLLGFNHSTSLSGARVQSFTDVELHDY